MNKDIRLKVTFPNHKKTIKLIHLIGFEGFYSLVHLWCYVAQNHPKGILKDYDKDDLEIAARWTGDRGAFTKAVTKKEISFVKKTAKGFEINDWEEHNPYVFHADERSEKARAAAKARWKPTDSKGSGDASSMQVAMPQASTSNAPSPLPSPPPKPEKNNALVEEVITHLNETCDKKYRANTDANIVIINARLAEGFTVDDLKYVVDVKSKQWKGDDKQDKYLRPETLFNKTKFEGYINEKMPKGEVYCTMPGVDGVDVDVYSKEEAEAQKVLLAQAAAERTGPGG